MLSLEDNKTITEVSAGTPMGELFRRFWLPIMASGDIPDPDGPPVRLRILNENLVAFRDSDGRVGVLDAVCPHRRAKLFWGRNEECGLRCAYHGWKFDVDGRCVDIPSEPAESHMADRITTRAYKVVEKAGMIWAYMGPKELEPPVPQFEWMDLAEGQVIGRSWLQRSNWLQSLEGDIDTAHVSFLHRWLDAETAPSPAPQFIEGYRNFVAADKAPRLFVRETDYGFFYAGRRTVGPDRYYWRFSHWIAPAGATVPGSIYRPLRFLTPIDDEHSLSLSLFWHESNDLKNHPMTAAMASNVGPPLQPYRLPDGYTIDVRQPERTVENDFMVDRETQRTTTFTGIPGGPADQDRAMTETMEPVLDRSNEHLGTTDVAIVAMRRKLLRLAHDLEKGVEPPMANLGSVVFHALDVASDKEDFDEVVAAHADELLGASGATFV